MSQQYTRSPLVTAIYTVPARHSNAHGPSSSQQYTQSPLMPQHHTRSQLMPQARAPGFIPDPATPGVVFPRTCSLALVQSIIRHWPFCQFILSGIIGKTSQQRTEANIIYILVLAIFIFHNDSVIFYWEHLSCLGLYTRLNIYSHILTTTGKKQVNHNDTILYP